MLRPPRWFPIPVALAFLGIALLTGRAGLIEPPGGGQPGPEGAPAAFSAAREPLRQLAFPAPPRIELAPPSHDPPGSTWVDLARMPWRRAITGWQVLADSDQPVINASFVYGPLRVAGRQFRTGISAYPFAENADTAPVTSPSTSHRLGAPNQARAMAAAEEIVTVNP